MARSPRFSHWSHFDVIATPLVCCFAPHPTVFEPTPRGIQARALESLVHAFLADPLFAHVFPNEERREQDLRRLFEGSLRPAARVGGVSTVRARRDRARAAWPPAPGVCA